MNYVHRKDLIAPARLKQLMQKSDAKAWRQLLSHIGAIALTTYLLSLGHGALWALPVFVLHGMLLNYLYAAQHELMHLTAFRTRWLNEFFSRITGFVVLFPRDYDRIMHFTHHRYTNLAGQDPELVGYNATQSYTWWSLLWRLIGIGYWLRRIGRILRLAFGFVTVESYMSESERATVIFEARLHLAVYAMIAALSVWQQSWAAVYYWLAPMLLTKGLHEVQNIVEHNGLAMVDNVLANTRTIQTNAFMRWIAWNMQYHCDHHLFAAVPFYNLPALHRELQDKIDNIAPSYRQALRDIVTKPRAHTIAAQNS